MGNIENMSSEQKDTQLNEQEYIQLKTELNDCIQLRNKLNMFMITTFVTVLGVALEYAKDKLWVFLFVQILMVPVLWRIINFKKIEYSLSKVIFDKFKDPWEKKRSDRNTFYFEFLTLSALVTGCFFGAIYTGATGMVAYAVSSSVVTGVIFFFSYKSSKLSTSNCDKSWCEILFGCSCKTTYCPPCEASTTQGDIFCPKCGKKKPA